MEGLQKYTGNTLRFEQGVRLTDETSVFIKETKINTTDRTGFEAAKAEARRADVVIMVFGEHGFQSGEGRSRTQLDLPGLQQELLEEVYKINPNIVLVMMNGRPLVIDWAADHIPAIVEAWHLGTESGNAIAQVLYGDYNPSGKLPMSFPKTIGQVPIYYNHKNTGRPDNPGGDIVFWSHYMDAPNEPQFVFGYGLSYTTFAYSNLKLNSDLFAKGGNIKVSVDLSNTGNYAGKETVQLYIHDLYASVTRPVRELKDFQQIELQPGETKTLVFTIDEKTIGFYDNEGKWIVEPGDFKVFVGGSSQADLEADFRYNNNKNEIIL